jgi:hypothetical protein
MANETNRRWAKRAVVTGVLGLGLAVSAEQLVGQQPAAPKAPPVAPAPTLDHARPVAYLYDTLPVTTAEFGKWLMDRGGADKLDTFVNIRIIEVEAAKRNITVTKSEMEAALAKDLEGIATNHTDFVKTLLPKYGKSLYEWMEDVVRPRLLLTKMCRDNVKVSDDHLKVQFERLHGEKRVVQMIIFPKSDDANTVAKIRGKILTDAAEFDSIARGQANPLLGATAGRIKPISRHLQGEDKRVEEMAFKLKVGEVSDILKSDQGYIILKLNEILPPNDKVTFETEKAKLYAAAFDEQLELEIPRQFQKLKEAALPKTMYSGPTDWKTVPASPVGSITVPGSGGVPGGGAIQQAGGKK